MPNQPNLSITSDMRMLAGIVSPANGPAPTLLTNNKPATTANAPTKPPSGAHHGIVLRPASVGIGRGRHKTRHARNATIGRKEGRKEERKEVRKEGRKKEREEERKEGRKEGSKEERKEGRKEGRKKGRKE